MLQWEKYQEVGEEYPAEWWSSYRDDKGIKKYAPKNTTDLIRGNKENFKSAGMAGFEESVFQAAENTPVGPLYTYVTGENPRGEKVGVGGRVLSAGVTASSIFAGPLTSKGIGAVKNQMAKRTISGKSSGTVARNTINSAENVITTLGNKAEDLTRKIDLEDIQPFRFVSKDAEKLLKQSQGRPGILTPSPKGRHLGHAYDHIPHDGMSPQQLAKSLSRKNNNTVWARPRHANQDLRNILNARAEDLATLKPGSEIQGTFRLPGKRYGYNSKKGANPESVAFDEVTYAISRTKDGRLHVEHFSPKISN